MYVLFVLFLVTACVGIGFTVETHMRFGKAKDNPKAQAAGMTALCVIGLAEIFMVLSGILAFFVRKRQRAAIKERWLKSIATEPDSEQQVLEYQDRLRKWGPMKP